MFRTIGMIAAFVFLFVLAGSVVPSYSSAGLADTTAVGDESKNGGENKKNGDEKKKKKLPPYAQKLKNKVKRPSPPPPKPKYKDWRKTLQDAKPQDGLIKVWTKQEDVWFEIRKDQLDVPFVAIMSISQGIGSHFVFGGLPIDDVMFDFHRSEDHVQVRRLSALFRAPNDKALQNAINLTFSESILEALPIVSEQNNGEVLLLQVDKFYLSDIAGMSMWLGGVLGQPVRLDGKKGYFEEIKVFPENLELDTRLTFTPGRAEILNLPNVPDPRNIQVGVQYSIRKLPENPIVPRLEDDRVGYFTTVHKDFEKVNGENFMVQYANRWRLEKKDPNAAMSEPKKPIVYYIDRTVPEEYVDCMIAGVEYWQKAFEAAGFKNAIIAKRAPTPEEDPAYDPEDARYNTLRWNVSDQTLYSAIGPSRTDPRTGEILDADILFEHNMIANFGAAYRRYAGPRAALMAVDPGLKELWMSEEERTAEIDFDDVPQLRNKAAMICNINDCMAENLAFQNLALLAAGEVDARLEFPKDFVCEALRFVSCHEVGHTLGLRHNFMSSGSTPFDKLNDKAAVEKIGLTGSIMDYPTVNVARNSKEQGYFYSPGVGTYDLWAIKWGYSEVPGDTPEEKAEQLEPIAAESYKKENLYGTDYDTYPAGALDPRSNIWDLSDDPLQWAMERIGVCDDILKSGKLEDRVVADGGNYVPLRNSLVTLLLQKYTASGMAVKYIGGQYTSRAHKGDPGGRVPFEPVPVREQRRALNFLVDYALSVDNWAMSADLLNKAVDDKQLNWQNNMYQPGRRFDFPISDWITAIQSAMIIRLMDPMLQRRVVEAQYKTDSPFQLSELYNALTNKIWTNNATPRGKNAGLHRNLQRVYVMMLINQVVTPPSATPFDAVDLSRLNLRRIRGTASTALQRAGLDDETNAHLMETVARIDRALEASRTTEF